MLPSDISSASSALVETLFSNTVFEPAEELDEIELLALELTELTVDDETELEEEEPDAAFMV